MVSVVVLNYNDANTTTKYINSIKDYSTIDHIVIVDNNSSDNSCEILKCLTSEKVELIQSGRNGGYGAGNNFGVNYLVNNYQTEYIAITNPDVKYSEDTLKKCVQNLMENKNKKLAVVAPRMRNIEGTVVDSTWEIPVLSDYFKLKLRLIGHGKRFDYTKFNKNEPNEIKLCGCVAGSMLVVNAPFFLECGGYDERIFLYCEETTLGIRLRRGGYKSAVLTDDFFVHEHSVSISKSIKSKVSQNKLLWKSRLFVLREYYSVDSVTYLMAYIVSKLSNFEVSLRIFKDRVKGN